MSQGNRRAVILVVFCLMLALIVSDYYPYWDGGHHTQREWTPYIVESK